MQNILDKKNTAILIFVSITYALSTKAKSEKSTSLGTKQLAPFKNINFGEHGKPLGRTMLNTKQLLRFIGHR